MRTDPARERRTQPEVLDPRRDRTPECEPDGSRPEGPHVVPVEGEHQARSDRDRDDHAHGRHDSGCAGIAQRIEGARKGSGGPGRREPQGVGREDERHDRRVLGSEITALEECRDQDVSEDQIRRSGWKKKETGAGQRTSYRLRERARGFRRGARELGQLGRGDRHREERDREDVQHLCAREVRHGTLHEESREKEIHPRREVHHAACRHHRTEGAERVGDTLYAVSEREPKPP